jgi:hypothetical protein
MKSLSLLHYIYVDAANIYSLLLMAKKYQEKMPHHHPQLQESVITAPCFTRETMTE